MRQNNILLWLAQVSTMAALLAAREAEIISLKCTIEQVSQGGSAALQPSEALLPSWEVSLDRNKHAAGNASPQVAKVRD